jgi:cytidine deaminase
MEIKRIYTELKSYKNRDELPAESANLLAIAHQAAENAYAPYSRFKVGAAILLANGKIVIGNNQENAVYPSGLCAERTAAFSASAQFPNISFKKIAVVAINPEKTQSVPVSPCGSCRQVLLEYEELAKDNIEVILAGEVGEVFVFNRIRDLLPYSFDGSFLPENEI